MVWWKFAYELEEFASPAHTVVEAWSYNRRSVREDAIARWAGAEVGPVPGAWRLLAGIAISVTATASGRFQNQAFRDFYLAVREVRHVRAGGNLSAARATLSRHMNRDLELSRASGDQI